MTRVLTLAIALVALSGCGAQGAPTVVNGSLSVATAAPALLQAAPSRPAANVTANSDLPSLGEARAFAAAQATPNALSVCTYNTGVGDKSHASQDRYTDLSMFQRVINGAADAPIIATQETGPALAQHLQSLRKQHPNYEVFWMTTTPLHQGNLLLVPKRFQVLAHDEEHYGGRLAQVFANLKDLKDANWGQTQEHRGYMWVELKDTQSGQRFTVLDSHISYWAAIRARQVKQFGEAIAKAETRGPVIACGDFNTPTEDTNHTHDSSVEKFWGVLAPLGLTDMGPTGLAGISDWGSAANIDHVLAKGFTSIHTHMYTGSELALTGFADAKSLSDHYPEEDVLAFH
jgi:endonuclease/exonuclease/phosphatase family metal-dependent hydrolase